MERILDNLPPSDAATQVPEALVGQVNYLHSLRVEATDNATRLGSHALRLHWPDVYLSRGNLSSKRCQLAHGALLTAFQSLAEAAREYERGLIRALETCGDGPTSRTPSMPVRLLDESGADAVARLRDTCDTALAHTVAVTRLRNAFLTVFEATWPVRRSEVDVLGADPYNGEVRPLGWAGFGDQPMLHPDAR